MEKEKQKSLEELFELINSNPVITSSEIIQSTKPILKYIFNPLKLLIKKMIMPFILPIIAQQNTLNSSFVQILNKLKESDGFTTLPDIHQKKTSSPDIKLQESTPAEEITDAEENIHLPDEENYYLEVKKRARPQVIEEYGFYEQEKVDIYTPLRWIKKEAGVTFRIDSSTGSQALFLQTNHPYPQHKNPLLTISANGKEYAALEIPFHDKLHIVPIEASSETIQIQLKLNETFPPDPDFPQKELGIRLRLIDLCSEKMAPLPVILELETSTYCNINPPCVMCYPRIFKDSTMKDTFIDQKALEHLLEYIHIFRNISLHGVGEPLVGNTLFKILEKIDTDSSVVHFTSNGLLLSEDKSRYLVERKLKLLNLSIDAASKETYYKLRHSDFDLVINNIRTLSSLKKLMNSDYPQIMMNMTLMKENICEALAFVDLAKELGATYVYYSILNEFRDYEVYNGEFRYNYKEQMPDYISKYFQDTMKQVKEKAEKIGIVPYIIIPQHRCSTEQKSTSVPLRNFFCTMPWEHMFVHANGNCSFCCRISFPEGFIGNLIQQSFEEVWHSRKAYELREKMAHGKMPGCCAQCDVYGQVR